jgi:predicted  nucleic acid-binding Zn-ribbon protein
METFLTSLFSGIGGMLTASIPAYIAYRRQKDAHEEAMTKILAERDEALAKNKAESEDSAYKRLESLCTKLETRIESLEESHKDCEKNYKELKGEYDELKKDHDKLKSDYDKLVNKG